MFLLLVIYIQTENKKRKKKLIKNNFKNKTFFLNCQIKYTNEKQVFLYGSIEKCKLSKQNYTNYTNINETIHN